MWLGWGLLILLVGAAVFFGCMVGGTYVSWELVPRMFGTGPAVYGLPVGAVAGLVIACRFAHRGRHWVMRWRLRRLRGTGIRTTASIAHVDRSVRSGARGGGSTTYRLTLTWTDPRTGEPYAARRLYRFYGISGSPAFERLTTGQSIPVSYPQDRPWRLVADIPFAPTMADLLT